MDGLDLGLEGWRYVCVSTDSLCRWQVQVSVYCARRIPSRYMLPIVYLSVADITNPDLVACGCWTWISLDIARIFEEQCQPL